MKIAEARKSNRSMTKKKRKVYLNKVKLSIDILSAGNDELSAENEKKLSALNESRTKNHKIVEERTILLFERT
jgi:hypothetical protein